MLYHHIIRALVANQRVGTPPRGHNMKLRWQKNNQIEKKNKYVAAYMFWPKKTSKGNHRELHMFGGQELELPDFFFLKRKKGGNH